MSVTRPTEKGSRRASHETPAFSGNLTCTAQLRNQWKFLKNAAALAGLAELFESLPDLLNELIDHSNPPIKHARADDHAWHKSLKKAEGIDCPVE